MSVQKFVMGNALQINGDVVAPIAVYTEGLVRCGNLLSVELESSIEHTADLKPAGTREG